VDLREWRRQLRGATHTGDAQTIVDVLSGQMPGECLQEAGAAVLVALAAGHPGAPALADSCRVALRERGALGDTELADAIETALGRRPPIELKATPVDLEELADVLDGPEGADPGVLDVVSGEVWPATAIEYAHEVDDTNAPAEPDGESRLAVWPEGSSAGYRDMQDFIATVEDPGIADRLSIAIEGKGAFRRFRDVIDRWPEQTTRWQAFFDNRRLGRARAWLADAGYQPAARSVPTDAS
jgi:hypothetical protein